MKKKIIIIAVALLVLLGGAGAGLYFTGIIGADASAAGDEATAENAGEGEAHAEGSSEGEGHGGGGLFKDELIYVQLDPIAAPVIIDRRVAAQVILTLSVQVRDISAKNDVVRLTPRLRDAMLSELYAAPVTRQHGDGAIDIAAIKERMLDVTRSLFDADEIVDVLVIKAVQTS